MRLFHHFVLQIVYLKFLPSDLLITFWSIFQEHDLSKIWDLCMNTNIIKIFIIGQIQIVTKFFFKFKNPYFWHISPMFGAKKVFPKNQAVIQNFIRVSGTMPKFREI